MTSSQSRDCEPITYCLIAPGCVTGPCESVESVALQKALSMPPGTEVVPLYRSFPSETERSSGWIPCSERLPEAGKQVMFWDAGGFSVGVKSNDDPDSMAWIDWMRTDRDGDYCDTFSVTHWMPLPKGPL